MKLIKKILKILSISGVLIFLGIWFFIETGIGFYYSETEQEALINEVKSADPLPQSVYFAYEKYKGPYDLTFYDYIFSICYHEIMDRNFDKENFSYVVTRNIWWMFDKRRSFLSLVVLTRYLERNTTPENVVAYCFRNEYYGGQIRDIGVASQKFYNLPLEELNERQVLELLVISDAPTRFSPERNPENLKKAVDVLMERK